MTISLGALQDSESFFQRHVFNDYLRKWVFLGLLIGAVAGVGAIVFYVAIDASTWLFLGQLVGLEPPSPAGEGDGSTIVTSAAREWALPLVVALGGLLSGFIVFTLAPEAEGHGTDAAIDSFHQKGGRIRTRIPPIKLLASAITIGSGGSAGREGPTAQIAAGFGSWLGEVFNLSAADRRTALAVGVGAGIGAIFKAPLGGAILAAEILYIRDFELDALIPAFIASVVGYSIFGAWAGWEPVFGEGLGLTFRDPETLIGFAGLGLVCGLTGILYVRVFYGTQRLFHSIPVPRHIKPALAGLIVGGMALFYPEVLSMGYGWLQLAMAGDTQSLAVGTMLVLVFLKIVATSLTIGSGGSGGVFAPGLFIGGMVGGAMYGLMEGVPWMPETPAPFVIVGMAALFGGVAKAPIAVILMVAEMTNEFSMIIPAMLAVTIAYLVTQDTRIYESQVETRADSPAHRSEYVIPLIQTVSVADAMRTDVARAAPSDAIDETEKRMIDAGQRGLAVVDQDDLVGVFTASDALRAAHADKRVIRDAMTTSLQVAYPADSVHVALRRMTQAGISRLPVVRRENPKHLLGMINTRDIAAALDAQLATLSRTAPEANRQPEAFDPFASLPVTEAMSRQFPAFHGETPARQVLDALLAAGAYAALEVDESGYLKGIATATDLRGVLDGDLAKPLCDVAQRPVIVARETQSLAEALAEPGAEAVRQMPVVRGRAGRLEPVGLLRRIDTVSALLRARERQATISRRLLARSGLSDNDVTAFDVSVHREDWLAGRSLAELNLPHEAVVTSLIRQGKPLIPRGRVVLQPGDQVQITTVVASRDLVLHQLTSHRGNGGHSTD